MHIYLHPATNVLAFICLHCIWITVFYTNIADDEMPVNEDFNKAVILN
jgi:hypothetical protein